MIIHFIDRQIVHFWATTGSPYVFYFVLVVWLCVMAVSDVIRNVPDSKWRLLSNVLARDGKTSKTVANWNN